jgi:hypothetical protein
MVAKSAGLAWVGAAMKQHQFVRYFTWIPLF